MRPGSPPVSLIAATAAALAMGTAAAEFISLPSGPCLLVAWAIFTGSVAAGRLIVSSSVRWTILRNTSLIVIVAVLAAARWTMISEANRTRPLHQLAQRDNLRVVIDAAVSSVPIQHARAVSRLGGGQHTNRWQTRFVAECLVVHAGGDPVAADGTIQVFVDGQAARRFGRGDTVRITGRLSWPDRPGNPGEFDFATFLSRRGGAGMLFVAHPQAVQILRTVGPLTPGYWLTRLRRAAQRALNSVVDPKYQGIASALLLGSRTEIPSETQEVFIGSGTMHLLAISGLHIGILYLLLIRVGHWLLIPWNQLLVLIALFCIFYAFMTDLRPSVVRATVFAVLFTASQVTVRQVSLPAVIGQTACLMLLWQPYLVFDTGAWLSFLSVTGLAWATRTAPPEASQDPIAHPQQDRAVPLTPTEHLQHRMLQMRHWLAARYRPMLWIMAATIPLIAWSFHVVSPVGLIVNVVLIAWTMLTLWLGFAAIMLGVLVPFVPNLPGIVFSWMLGGLAWIVETAASVGAGHLYFADLPFWFLPTWYGLLITAVSLRRSQYRKIAWLGLCGLISSALWVRSLDHADHGLRCTVLDVGHGSAAVVELPGSGVMLVDAGAMNRGDRAAEIVSRCLWERGHRMINSVVVSHADVDHFNALGKILPRFRVGELLLSKQFLQNESEAARQLVALAAEYRVRVRIVGNGEWFKAGGIETQILQASPHHLANARSDNEKSLVVQIRYADRTILLPGDLEGAGLDDILPALSHADVLVSPHHGSLKANLPGVAEQLKPQHVIISARDDSSRPRLEHIYPSSRLHFTSSGGAVRVDVAPHGMLAVSPFRSLNH